MFSVVPSFFFLFFSFSFPVATDDRKPPSRLFLPVFFPPSSSCGAGGEAVRPSCPACPYLSPPFFSLGEGGRRGRASFSSFLSSPGLCACSARDVADFLLYFLFSTGRENQSGGKAAPLRVPHPSPFFPLTAGGRTKSCPGPFPFFFLPDYWEKKLERTRAMS